MRSLAAYRQKKSGVKPDFRGGFIAMKNISAMGVDYQCFLMNRMWHIAACDKLTQSIQNLGKADTPKLLLRD